MQTLRVVCTQRAVGPNYHGPFRSARTATDSNGIARAQQQQCVSNWA